MSILNIPHSTEQTSVFLPPKGTAIQVPTVRQAPRSRTIVLANGTYPVRYIVQDADPYSYDTMRTFYVVSKTSDNEEAYNMQSIVVQGSDQSHVIHGVKSKDGDDIFDDALMDDGKVWGWYGLDWFFDEDSVDGYMRLRRMMRQTYDASQAAYARDI